LASSSFFLAAKPLLQLALLQMFDDGDYLGFFVLFFLAAKALNLQPALFQMFNDDDYHDFFPLFFLLPKPFCSWLSFKCLKMTITMTSFPCFPCCRTPSAADSHLNVKLRRFSWLLRLFFLATEPLLQLATNETTVITLAFCLVFLAAKPLLLLALFQMFDDGHYLGFFVFFFLAAEPLLLLAIL
jgi:hypothetical protein